MRTIIFRGLLACMLVFGVLIPSTALALDRQQEIVSTAPVQGNGASMNDARQSLLSSSTGESRSDGGAQTLRIGLSALALAVALFVQASPGKRRTRR